MVTKELLDKFEVGKYLEFGTGKRYRKLSQQVWRDIDFPDVLFSTDEMLECYSGWTAVIRKQWKVVSSMNISDVINMDFYKVQTRRFRFGDKDCLIAFDKDTNEVTFEVFEN